MGKTNEKKSAKATKEKEAPKTGEEARATEETVAEQPSSVAVTEMYVPEVPKDFKTRLNSEQQELLKNTIAVGASNDELKMFLYVCQRTGLDPFTQQIHLVPIWNSMVGAEVRVPIIGINGLRVVAEKSGSYIGSDDAVFEGEKDLTIKETTWVQEGARRVKKEQDKTIKVPLKATVTVRKVVQGQIGTFTASAEWDEYCPRKVNINWQTKPKIMLSKCAEAKALRKAFPMVLSGLYINEEVETQKKEYIDVTPPSVFEKAKKLIEKMDNPDDLDRAWTKIEASDKYSADDKKAIKDLIDKQKKDIIDAVNKQQ